MNLDVADDGVFQFAGAAMEPTPNLLLGQHGEPALHQVDPGGSSRREVETEARLLRALYSILRSGRFVLAAPNL